MVSLLVMLACCEWTSKLCSVGYLVIILCIFALLYLWFSSYLAYECIPFGHQNLQPENLSKTLKPSFVWLNIWDCVGLFLCILETIYATNRTQSFNTCVRLVGKVTSCTYWSMGLTALLWHFCELPEVNL